TTANFGVVPAIITAYDSDTCVASFRTYNFFNNGTTDLLAGTNSTFAADLGAVTTCCCVELPECLHGSPINSYGVLMEETQQGPIKIMDTGIGFGNVNPSTMEGWHFNSSPDIPTAAPDNVNAVESYKKAVYLAGQFFETFCASINCPLTVRNINLAIGHGIY